jgi:hypothetical protein
MLLLMDAIVNDKSEVTRRLLLSFVDAQVYARREK